MKFLILILLGASLQSFSQEKKIPWHGLVQVRIENKVFNFNGISDLNKIDRLIVSAASQGIALNKGPTRTGLLAFSVSLIGNDNLLHGSRLNSFNLSLIKMGQMDAAKDGKSGNYFSLSFLNWDKENFGENAPNPITVYRFKPFQAEFVSVRKVGKNVKVKFSGKLELTQSVIKSDLSESLQARIAEFTDEEVAFGLSATREGGVYNFYGVGLEGHNFVGIQRRIWDSQESGNGRVGAILSTFEIFLGDAETSFGIELFDFLEANASIGFDSATGNNLSNSKFLSMNSLQKRAEVSVNLGELIKKSEALNGLGVYAYFQQERLIVQQEDFGYAGEIPKYENLDFKDQFNVNLFGVGLRWRFGKKRYRSVIKPIF